MSRRIRVDAAGICCHRPAHPRPPPRLAAYEKRLIARLLRVEPRRGFLHALAYNLGTFLRTLALPEGVERRSLTTLREKLIKIGARVVATAASSLSDLSANPLIPLNCAKTHKSMTSITYGLTPTGC